MKENKLAEVFRRSCEREQITFNGLTLNVCGLESLGDARLIEAFRREFNMNTTLNPRGLSFDNNQDFLTHLARLRAGALDAINENAPQYTDILLRICRLQQFHKALSGYFPGNELEPIAGYVAIMLMNDDPQMQARSGFLRHKIVYLTEAGTDKIVGGVSFSMFLGENARRYDAVTAHDTYIFVAPESRTLGVATRLGDLIHDESVAYARDKGGIAAPEVFIFTEQNMPLKMTFGEYVTDLSMAMDPCSRLKAWQRMGSQRLDFDYVQPPLDEGMNAVRMMALNIHPPASEAEDYLTGGLSAAIVENHLRMFVDSSVLKQEDAFDHDADCQAMAAQLQGQGRVPLVSDDIEMMQRRIYTLFDLSFCGMIPASDLQGGGRPLGTLLEAYSDMISAYEGQMTPERIRQLQADIKSSAASGGPRSHASDPAIRQGLAECDDLRLSM